MPYRPELEHMKDVFAQYLDRKVFLYDGKFPEGVWMCDVQDERMSVAQQLRDRFDTYFKGGNLDYIGHCFKVSTDKYWESPNESFGYFCSRKNFANVTPRMERRFAWFEKQRQAYRMIPPSRVQGYASFAKYDRLQFDVDEEAMRQAGEWTKVHFAPYCLGSRVMDVVSVWEAMDKQTSSGYPWSLQWPKKSMIPIDVVQDVCDLYWESLAKERCDYVPLWTCSQKRELRSREKIDAGRIRTFTASPFEQTVCMNRMCLDMNERFYSSNPFTWSFVGCSKFSSGWDRLYRKLAKHPCAFELDEKDFDCSLLAYLMYGQAQLRFEMLRGDDQTAENKRRLWNLYDQAVHSLVVMEDGLLVRKHTGNPSGSANTIVDNTMILFRLFAYAWILLHEEYLPEKKVLYTEFMRDVSAKLNGDDNTYSCAKDVSEWFNPSNIARVWSSIGVVTKTPCEAPRKVEECEFLSQAFVKLGRDFMPTQGPGVWCPSPETDRVLCSLMWASKKQDVRWHFLRACALRLDSWANIDCREILSDYITYLLNSHWRDSLIGEIDGIPIEQILGLWRSDMWCWALYTGLERVIDGNACLPFQNFESSVSFTDSVLREYRLDAK